MSVNSLLDNSIKPWAKLKVQDVEAKGNLNVSGTASVQNLNVSGNSAVLNVTAQDVDVSNSLFVGSSAELAGEVKISDGAVDGSNNYFLKCSNTEGKVSWSSLPPASIPSAISCDTVLAQVSLSTNGESSLGTASSNSLIVVGEVKLPLNSTAQAGYILSSTDASGTCQWIAPSGGGGSPASVYVNTQSNSGNVLLPAGYNQLPTGTLVSSSNPADWALGSNTITYLGATPKVFVVSLKAIFERTDGSLTSDSLSLFSDLNGSPLPSAVSSTTWIEKTQGNLFTLSDTIIVPIVTGNSLSFRVFSSGNNIYTNSNSGVPNTSISIVSLN